MVDGRDHLEPLEAGVAQPQRGPMQRGGGDVSDRLGAWIVKAQADADLDPALPPEVVLYTIYARACDPVPGVLKAGMRYSDGQIVDWVLATCMNGLRRRPT